MHEENGVKFYLSAGVKEIIGEDGKVGVPSMSWSKEWVAGNIRLKSFSTLKVRVLNTYNIGDYVWESTLDVVEGVHVCTTFVMELFLFA